MRLRRVPAAPGIASPDLRLAIVAGVIAIGCLVAAGAFGSIHGHLLHQKVIAAAGAAGFLVSAIVAVRRTADEFYRVLTPRAGPSHAAIIRLLITVFGCAIALLAALGLLAVPVQHLLLGGALTGVILGIAAQQALGNIFAGLVLLLARPFNVGDDIYIRAGALGGELTGRVTGMGLTYVRVDTTERGELSIPNSGMLAAVIGSGDSYASRSTT